MTRYLITLFIFSISAIATMAREPLAEVEKYTKGGDYTAAISVLTGEASEHGYSSAMYCDLGILYHEAGNFGASVASFQRALSLDPHNRQARNNLAYTLAEVQLLNESLLGDRNLDATPAESSGLSALADMIARPGSNLWTGLSVIMFLLAISGAGAYILSRSVAIKKWGFFGGGILLFLSMAMLVLADVARKTQLRSDRGVIMSPQISLQSAPGKDGKPVAAPLVGGTPVKILATKTAKDSVEWMQVALNPDYTGWIPASEIEKISAPMK